MRTFLPDVYEETDDDSRWRYIPSDSMPGVVIYDDKFAYSHHATDPAGGKLLNAFDLVRAVVPKHGMVTAVTPDASQISLDVQTQTDW